MKHITEFETDYAFLAQGKSLGKKVDVLVNTSDGDFDIVINPATVSVLEVRGPDEAAMNLQLTICPPLIIPIDGTVLTLAKAQQEVDAQSASGSTSFAGNEDGDSKVVATPMIAIINWGIGGVNNEKVEVDILNGLNINLTASFLRVEVSADPYLNTLGSRLAGSKAIYELSAFVGPGYAKPNNAQRTIRFKRVEYEANEGGPFGTTPIVPIPKYATRCSLGVGTFGVPSNVQGWVAQIVFFADYGTGYALNPNPATWPTPVACITAADNGNGGKFEIPNGAYYAAVIHKNSFAIIPSLIFDLGI